MRKLGIYVQVPFCQTKCTYCNFHTGVVASSRFAPYVEAVCGEIRGHRKLLRAAGISWGSGEWRVTSGEQEGTEFVVDTVYIGGGTPSLLNPAHLQNILDAIRETFNKRPTSPRSAGRAPGGPYGARFEEVTLEADPETVEVGKAAAWVQAGINRVSFGL